MIFLMPVVVVVLRPSCVCALQAGVKQEQRVNAQRALEAALRPREKPQTQAPQTRETFRL